MSAEWLVPGAEAVVLQPSNRASMRAETVTVERVMKRDVVLSNGDRYRIDRLEKQVGGTWGTTYYLVPADDPRIAQTRAAIALTNLRYRAEAAYENWRRGNAGADEVAQAFMALHNRQGGAS